LSLALIRRFLQRMKDPAFAKSPHERLDFFYKKYLLWDL